MEGFSLKGAWLRSTGKFFSLTSMIATAAIATSGCNAEDAGGVASAGSGRRTLASADIEAYGADQMTIAVKYVAFRNASGTPVVDEGSIAPMINRMNSMWSQCNIGFKLERYEAVDPSYLGARLNPANYSELDSMREQARSDQFITIIATGTWNRAGDLGNSGSNCYSSFPGDSADGIVCEQRTAVGPTIMAHEVGHWFHLFHTDNPAADEVNDTTSANSGYNLMNHVVAPENTVLTKGQCVRARSAIATYRRNAVI